MREEILDLLKREKKALSIIDISDRLNLNTVEGITKISETLKELEEETLIYKSNKEKYMLFEGSHLLKGRLNVNKKGFGFLIVDNSDDIYVSDKNMNGALNNDIVVAEPIVVKGKKEARIIKVLRKENIFVVGEFNLIDGVPHFTPDDDKLKVEIIIDDEDLDKLIDGYKIKVSIKRELSKYKYLAKVDKILGHKNDPGVDILSIVYDHDINDIFNESVINELDSIPTEVSEEDKKGRRDLTNEIIFTIDGDDTKDIDDAISIKKNKDNYILGVHIADVSYYVKEDSEIYKEAKERATSVYLADRVIPMIPHKLSNGICSLNPDDERLAISCVMEIDKNGKVVSHEIFESVIKSKKQMTYKNVNKILDNKEIPSGYELYVDDLKVMEELAQILRASKIKNGYLDFDTDEAKIIVDDKGKAIDVVLRDRGKAENLIEDFMIVANETVASHIYYMNLPFIYRIHEIPENEKVNEFLGSISILGYKIKGERNFKYPKSMQNILEQIKDKEEFKILSNLLLRCMKKAVYKEENLGHYGLASKCYTHFTSPIRRFPDTTVHNLLRKYIFEQPDDKKLNELISKYEQILPEICEHSSKKERDSIECERDVESMKMAEYMEGHIGEEYDGIISSIMNFGMFVQLDNMIEGLVHISELKGDYYNYDDATKTLRGQRRGKIYTLGQKVRVVVTNASKEKSIIDFNIVGDDKNGNTK